MTPANHSYCDFGSIMPEARIQGVKAEHLFIRMRRDYAVNRPRTDRALSPVRIGARPPRGADFHQSENRPGVADGSKSGPGSRPSPQVWRARFRTDDLHGPFRLPSPTA